MRRKPTIGRRIQTLHDLASDSGYIALIQPAEDRKWYRHREKMSKISSAADDYRRVNVRFFLSSPTRTEHRL